MKISTLRFPRPFSISPLLRTGAVAQNAVWARKMVLSLTLELSPEGECFVGTESVLLFWVPTLKEAVPPQEIDPHLEAIFVPGKHAQTSIMKH